MNTHADQVVFIMGLVARVHSELVLFTFKFALGDTDGALDNLEAAQNALSDIPVRIADMLGIEIS
jgi:hypothetical protein